MGDRTRERRPSVAQRQRFTDHQMGLQQPVLPQITVKTITCGKEEAERQQAISDIWENANRLQAAYRQLQYIQRAIAKAKVSNYNDIPQHIKARIDKTYHEHAAIINTNTNDAAKAGLITTNASKSSSSWN